MSEQTTGSGTVQFPDAAPLTAPVIRPVGIPLYMGRAYTADGGETWVRITPRGHWRVYGPRDEQRPAGRRACKGCGGTWLVCILEDSACPKAPSGQDIADALIGRQAVAL